MDKINALDKVTRFLNAGHRTHKINPCDELLSGYMRTFFTLLIEKG